jgi:hypothetical protein
MVQQPSRQAETAEAPAAADFGNLADAHAELLRERDIQFDFPPAELPPPRVPEPSGLNLAPLLEVVFWIVVALAAAGLIYLIVTRLTGFSWRRRVKDAAATADQADWRPDAVRARTLLEEADALAAEGRFSEAAHLLLHRSIEDIDQRRPETVRPALTSRELAGLPALPPEPASAFGSIVRAVERSLFGGRALAEPDWRDCRAAYERFAFAAAWRQ